VIDLEITWPEGGANPLERLAARLPAVMANALEQALQAGLAESQARLHGGGGPSSKTGFLERSLAVEVWGEGDGAQGRLFSDAPYAAVHEFGAVIQARRAKWLKFQVAGRWVQVQRVMIPARPFLGPGLEAAGAALEEALSNALMEEFA
jgi:phage gpG-like protein